MCTCSSLPARRKPGAAEACVPCRRWALAWSHRAELLAVARRRLPSRDDADDVVNEAMLRAVLYDELDESRIAPWMTRVLVNLCTDHGRDLARDSKRRHYAVMMDMPLPTPEDIAVDRAGAATACERLRALPTSQQQAVLLRASGLSVTDVAASLDIGYKATESLLSRARSAIRAALVAGVAGIYGAARTGRRAAAPATAVALTAVAVAVWLQPTAPPAAGPPPAELAQAVTSAGVPDRLPPAPDVQTKKPPAADRSRGAVVVPPATDRASAGVAAESVVPPIRADAAGIGLTVGGVTATEHEQEWHQALAQCLLDTPQVTPQHVGCPPPGEKNEAGPEDAPVSP